MTVHGPEPLFEQVANDLRDAITDGRLNPGDPVPSETELVASYRVSRQTVQRAISRLTSEGLITSGRGRRRLVRGRRPMVYRPQEELLSRPKNPEMDQFIERFSDEGREPHQEIEVVVSAPPSEVGSRLRLNEGDLTIVRKRVRYLDNDPSHINDTYFPYDLAKDTEIMKPDDIARGTLRVLRDIGSAQDRVLDEIWVRMPTADEVRRLALLPGTPVAQHIRTGYAENGRPVRCAVSVLPGDRHVIALEFGVPEDWE